jgi:hypothetical protein
VNAGDLRGVCKAFAVAKALNVGGIAETARLLRFR